MWIIHAISKTDIANLVVCGRKKSDFFFNFPQGNNVLPQYRADKSCLTTNLEEKMKKIRNRFVNNYLNKTVKMN